MSGTEADAAGGEPGAGGRGGREERAGGGTAASVPRDDRVLIATRVVAALVLPFLVVAAVLLYAFPARTGELFAWPIAPPLSAYLLASAYIGGVWFFIRVVLAREWHTVRHGFPAVVVFASALLAATLLHLDRFSQNLSFAVWLLLYATTPVAVALLAVVQARRDPRATDPSDVVIGMPARVTLVAMGAAALLVGAALFLAPAAATQWWAWELTPLTARVTGAVFSLTGVVGAALLRDARWSAFRILFQAQLISLLAIAASLVAGGDALRWDRPATPALLALIAAALVIYGALAIRTEMRAADR